MPLDYHAGNVTFWIFQTAAGTDGASARIRISLSDEAEKRWKEKERERKRGERERGSEREMKEGTKGNEG